jgi:hypothetical protein
MRSRDSLLVALVAGVVGLGAGFSIAALLEGGRPAQAAGPTARVAPLPQPRASDGRAAETREDLRDVERTTAAAAPLEAREVRLPEAELERALDTIQAPSVEAELGGGTITGEVQDEWGMPLQGAVVVGRPNDRTRAVDPDEVGGGPPEELSLEDHLRASAKTWARTRGRERRAVSGADGRFELDGLTEDASYSLTAYLEGRALEAEGSTTSVSPGQRIVFRAETVHAIPVQLVFAAGGPPGEGLVGVKRGELERLYTWTAADPVLRLTPGRVVLRGYAGVMRSEGGRAPVDSSHASQELGIEVADQAGAALVLALEPRRGIRGRVVEDSGTGGGRSTVRLLALGSDGELDLDALTESRRSARLDGDRFHLLDLEPGPYAVGLTDGSQALLAHELATVGEGVVEVELRVPEPDPDEHLIVRAFGPSGRALRDLEFRWLSRAGTGSRSGGIQGRRAADGSFWLRPKADFFGAWGKEWSFTLTVVHSVLGERELALEEGQREVEVTFAEPVTLVVVVAGYAGSGYVGKLQVALAPVTASGSEPGTRSGTFRSSRRNEDPFSPEGVARFEGLAPGRWKVDLLVRSGDWQTRVVRSAEVQAAAGEQTVAIDLPALYDLAVVTPGLDESGYLFLTPASAEGSNGDFDGGTHAQIGAGGRTLFRGLAAGDYVLRGSGLHEAVEITVPCSDVYVDAKEPDCLRVAIGDLEGSMYRAGLRAGDLIVAVGGVDLGSTANQFELLMGTGPVELSVLRDGATHALAIQRIPNGADWWAELGGMLTPASR